MSPALITQLHLELELAIDGHKFAVRLVVDCTPGHVKKGGHVKLVFDLKVERGVPPEKRYALPSMKLLKLRILDSFLVLLVLLPFDLPLEMLD